MADEILDGADMIGQLFGECQRVTYETGDALPQCVIEPLDVISFPGFLCDSCMLSSWNHLWAPKTQHHENSADEHPCHHAARRS